MTVLLCSAAAEGTVPELTVSAAGWSVNCSVSCSAGGAGGFCTNNGTMDVHPQSELEGMSR